MLAVLNLHHKDHAGSVGTILCAAFDTVSLFSLVFSISDNLNGKKVHIVKQN